MYTNFVVADTRVGEHIEEHQRQRHPRSRVDPPARAELGEHAHVRRHPRRTRLRRPEGLPRELRGTIFAAVCGLILLVDTPNLAHREPCVTLFGV